MSLVSVIIPTTRRPGPLRRALTSVFTQTHDALEAIVVIDGPNPETVAMLAALSDPRLRVLQNERSLGPGLARNAGAAVARGEWLAFLDDDDEWLADKLERQLAGAQASDAVLITCRCRVITPQASYVWPRRTYDGKTAVDEYLWQRHSLFRGEAYLATASYVLPRWLFLQAQFGATRNNEDDTLLLRLTKECGTRIFMVPDVLAIIHADDPRNSLGGSFPWRDALAWIESMGKLVTPRAYSGFCLVVLASQARRAGDYGGLVTLLRRSVSRGAPTANQLLLFAVFLVLPIGLRQRLRAMAQSVSAKAWRRPPAAEPHADPK